MTDAVPAYRKLPGKGRTWMGYDRLWLADDHLLVVKTRGFAEHYERYYLRDVQALLLRRTPGHGRRMAVMGGLLALLLLAGALHAAGRPVWLTLGTLVAVFLAFEWLLGPSSAVHLRTPLQTVELRPLQRLRNARRVLGELQIRIGEAQGAVSAEQIALGLPEVAAQPEAPTLATSRLASPPKLPTRYRGAWHSALFLALLLEATVTLFQLNVDSGALDLGAMLLYLVMVSLAITALVRQRQSQVIGTGVRRLTWGVLGFLALVFVSLWGFGTAHSFVALAESPLGVASPFDAPGVRFHHYAVIAGAALLGTWGLLLMQRRTAAARPA